MILYNTGTDYIFSRADGKHRHVINSQKVSKHVVSVAVKRKALENITLRPKKMIDAELKGVSDYLNVY